MRDVVPFTIQLAQQEATTCLTGKTGWRVHMKHERCHSLLHFNALFLAMAHCNIVNQEANPIKKGGGGFTRIPLFRRMWWGRANFREQL